MKKSYLGAAAVLSVLTLTACSDDSSSGGSPDVLPSSSSGVVILDPSQGNPGLVSSSSFGTTNPILSSSVDALVSSSSVAEVIEVPITEIPISEEEKKDDGTGSVSSQSYSISGTAAFGPYNSGATVSVAPVDVATMTAGAATGSATVKDKKGSFSASGSLTSAVASIEVSGKYNNISLDKSEGPVTVKALVDLRNKTTANVNVLTHLEYGRVQNLVATQGLSFTAAKVRAEKEVLTALGLKSDSTLFEDISLYGTDEASMNLMAVTIALLTERSSADASALLNALAEDLAADGLLDNDANKASLGDVAYFMDIVFPKNIISELNNDAEVPYFKGTADRIWAAMYNLGTCNSSKNETVVQNGNLSSSNAALYFVCLDTVWSLASEIYLANYAATLAFGACTEAISGTVKDNGAGTNYICKGTSWAIATEEDLQGAAVAAQAGACTSANNGAVVSYQSSYFICQSSFWRKLNATPVDYSKGRAMNKKLGRGINFGNSWEAPSNDDSGWSNPINDGDFTTVKSAGFNSVRIPVRWYTGMDNKLNGVKADVTTAINAGLVVIINYHHYEPMYEAAKNGNLDSKISEFSNEWKKIAQAFDSFSDDKLVFEIFNEPHDMSQDQVNKIMTAGYKAIRSVSKGKTIMFESNGYSKFAMITKLDLPNDGNIIVSGHYYEPYTFTHQGHGYDCNGNAGDGISLMPKNFKAYADSIAAHFPDINGGSVPMNMGEFGVANKGSCSAVSDSKRDAWTKAAVEEAEKYGMSWHYWCFKNCGGFEASNGSSWHSNMLSSLKMK